MAKEGRPTAYSKEMADEICERMASGQSLRHICSDQYMPAISTVMLWRAKDKASTDDNDNPYKGFSEQYEIAQEARFYYHADELLDIADDGTNDWMERVDKDGNESGWQVNGEAIQRSRLRVDARKWMLSKLLPKYADKVQQEVSGPNGGAVKTESTWVIQPVKVRGDE